MTFGDIVKIDRITPDGEWEECLTLRALQVNGGKASDFDAAGTDTASKRVQFRVRWNRCLPPVELRPARYRIRWRGGEYRVADYDDYLYRHRTVDLTGESYG